jgi:hypothetical protein
MKRFSVIGAAALAFGLVGAGTALADGASENDSDTNIGTNQNWLPDTGKGAKVDLFAQVRTVDADGSGTVGNIHDQEVEKVNMHFDDNITFVTTRARRCANDTGPPVTTLAGTTTQVALDRCGKAAIGSGNASIRVPTGLTPPAPASTQVDLTVTTFLGDPNPVGAGFTGGDEIMLHAFVNAGGPALPTVLVQGELRDSTVGGDFGKELNVPDAPDVGGTNPGDGALVLFNSTIGKSTKFKKGKKKKKKTQQLVWATCDAQGDAFLDIQTRFEYDDASVDTDNSGQNCGEK